jgi:hypothetical protein
MAVVLNRDDAPQHIFNIPEPDFSADLFRGAREAVDDGAA